MNFYELFLNFINKQIILHFNSFLIFNLIIPIWIQFFHFFLHIWSCWKIKNNQIFFLLLEYHFIVLNISILKNLFIINFHFIKLKIIINLYQFLRFNLLGLIILIELFLFILNHKISIPKKIDLNFQVINRLKNLNWIINLNINNHYLFD